MTRVVSYQEELLYGAYAPALRQLGNAVQAAESATDLIRDLRDASADVDRISAGKTYPPSLDDQGRTPHTAWLDDVYETLNGLMQDARRSHRALAVSFMDRWFVRTEPEGPTEEGDISFPAVGTPLTEDALAEHLARVFSQRPSRVAGALMIHPDLWTAAVEALRGSGSSGSAWMTCFQDLKKRGDIVVRDSFEPDRWGIRLVDPDVDG